MRGWAGLRESLRQRRLADPARFRVEVVLAGLLVVLLARVLFGDHPWSSGIALRVHEGESVRPKDYAATWGFWVSLGNAAAIAILWRTLRAWPFGDVPRVSAVFAPPAAPPRACVAVTIAAITVSAALAWPRLSQGLWQDEEHTVTSYVGGAYLADADGELRFYDTGWDDAFLYDNTPNNHVPYSVLARALIGVQQALERPQDRRVREPVLRLPAFVFGLLALVAIAHLLWHLGFPWAGAIAAWILALHPWMLRYTSEARGYSLLLALVPACLVLMLHALHRGTWRNFALYGAAQTLLLWTYPAAIYPVLVMNLVFAALLFRVHARTPEARPQAIRFVLANGVGALVFLQLMAANIAMMAGYSEAKSARDLGWPWLRRFFAHLFAGTPWGHGAEGGDPVYPELFDLATGTPLAFWLVVGATGALALAGAVRLVRSGGAGPWIALVLLLPTPLGYLGSILREDFAYARYLIFALPSFAALVALGLTYAHRSRVLTLALIAGYLTGFVWVTHPGRLALRERSLLPYRDSVAATRESLDPFAPEHANTITASFSAEPWYYDPHVARLREPEELDALIQRATEAGLPLYMNLGRIRLARRRHAELLARVEDEAAFELAAVFHGFEPKFTRRVYRYVGPGAAR